MFLWLRVLRTDLRFENRVLKKIFSATPFVVGDDTKIWFLRSQNRRAFFGIISPDSWGERGFYDLFMDNTCLTTLGSSYFLGQSQGNSELERHDFKSSLIICILLGKMIRFPLFLSLVLGSSIFVLWVWHLGGVLAPSEDIEERIYFVWSGGLNVIEKTVFQHNGRSFETEILPPTNRCRVSERKKRYFLLLFINGISGWQELWLFCRLFNVDSRILGVIWPLGYLGVTFCLNIVCFVRNTLKKLWDIL